MSFRTLTVGVDGIVKLIAELGTQNDVRICSPAIPKGTGIAGVTYDEEARTFDVKLVHHNWPDDIPADQPVTVMYAVRLGRSGTAGDWGMPTPIGPDSA